MRRYGFTLAEVLITLGIIGVVAALTIPALLTKCNEVTTTARLKKVYAIITNAEKLAVSDYGTPDGWDLALTDGKEDYNLGNQSAGEIFWNTYYLPYLKNISEPTQYKTYKCNNMNGENFDCRGFKRTVFSDGSCINHFINKQFYFLIYDINCSAPPNTLGKDVWDIAELNWSSYTAQHWSKFETDNLVRAQIPRLRQLRENPSLRTEYINQCKSHTYISGSPSRCFAVFVADGWKFSKDLHW